MKTLVEYINESNFLDNVPDNYKNSDIINYILDMLKKYKIPAKYDGLSGTTIFIWNPKNAFNGFSSGFSIHINDKTNLNIPGFLYASHEFSNESVYLGVTASFNGEDDKKIFDILMRSNLKEATNGNNDQWGSYKFAIKSEEDLIFICELLKKHIKKI